MAAASAFEEKKIRTRTVIIDMIYVDGAMMERMCAWYGIRNIVGRPMHVTTVGSPFRGGIRYYYTNFGIFVFSGELRPTIYQRI